MTAPIPTAAAAVPTAPKRQRDSLFLLAKLRVERDDRVHEVRIRNLSEGGTMAEFAQPVASDTAVELELRGIGAVAGRVAWYEDGRMGIAFDRPIDPKLARKPVGQGARPRR